MGALMFALSPDDDIWTYNMPLADLANLIRDPRIHVTSQRMPDDLRTVTFEGPLQPTAPISIEFIYTLGDDDGSVDTIQVQGVDKTPVVTVRMPTIPRLSVKFDNAKNITRYVDDLERDIPAPMLESKRLETPRIAFSHFNPASGDDPAYARIAWFISNPELIPAYLNRIPPDVDPKIKRQSGAEDPDPKVTRFRMIEDPLRFRYHFVSALQVDVNLATIICGEGQILRQCSKPSGMYTENGTVEMHMDDVQQVLWCDDV